MRNDMAEAGVGRSTGMVHIVPSNNIEEIGDRRRALQAHAAQLAPQLLLLLVIHSRRVMSSASNPRPRPVERHPSFSSEVVRRERRTGVTRTCDALAGA